MAIVGLMQFYNDYIGFDGTYEDALKVKRAVLKSNVSIEVKWFIENAAEQLKLTDDYKPDWEKNDDKHLFKAPEEESASDDEEPGDELPF